jgi:HAD superfamily hydrolase (TIGR01509 family)
MTHIIFDCDGVLVDSEAISMGIDQRLLAENGVSLAIEDMHFRFVGMTFEDMARDVEKRYHITLPKDLEARKDALMAEAYEKDLPTIPGLKPALLTLKAQGHDFAIGSNGPKHRIHLALGLLGLQGLFDRIVTFEDVVNPKPAPDLYVLAASLRGVAPRACLIVEDSVTGTKAAVASGAKVLGFTGTHADPYQHGEQLKNHGAHYVFHHMDELVRTVAAAT